MTLTAGTRLGHYEILSPLGAGGMGEVYRARDGKLDRDVAVKVLPASVASDPEALARFEREAKAVAALSHPNILAIYDFGAQGGVAYAVMELLEGETLRARLESGPIPQKDAVDYGQQIARGLSAAHERGVVHRDLKPENLFVSRDGHLKILDFGLAKRDARVAPGEETSAPTQSGHTEPGTVMGTVGYMSPEQVRGLPVDHRTDIFSFGAVLYELLSGKRAFRKETAADTMSAILNEQPPQLTQTGRNVSVGLDHVVAHCLEKDRDRRFQSARDIVFALGEASGAVTGVARPAARRRRLWIAASALLVFAVAVGLIVAKRSVKPTPPGVKRIAVLPFENLGAPEDDYFADGMADEVRGKLTSLPGLQVIARASSTPYGKVTKPPQEIAKELDAQFLLMATLRWEKAEGGTGRVIVRPELVDVSGSGAPTVAWQQPFDVPLTNVFHVQSDIATRVASALGETIGAAQQRRLQATPTGNLAAYDSFLKGEEAFRKFDQEQKALAYYEQAVALDPGFAQAWAGIGWVGSWVYGTERPSPELAARVREASEKAIALAPNVGDGYLALGTYFFFVHRDLNRALEQLSRGQRLAPSNADLLITRGVIEVNLGLWEEALEHYRQAERLDPRAADPRIFLGAELMALRRFREAKEVLDRGLVLHPANIPLVWSKALNLLAQGDLPSARAFLKTKSSQIDSGALAAASANFAQAGWALDDASRDLLLKLTPDAFGGDRGSWALTLANEYALNGRASEVFTHAEEARKAFEEQLSLSPDLPRLHEGLGAALAYLGRKDEALREANRAIELSPGVRDGWSTIGYRHNLVRTYVTLGEHEKALDELESLLKVPGTLSPGWLRIDPNFEPLRSNPRFQKLVPGK